MSNPHYPNWKNGSKYRVNGRDKNNLTNRARQVAQLCGQGYSVEETMGCLDMSYKMVRNYMTDIRQAAGIPQVGDWDRKQIIRWCKEQYPEGVAA